MCLRCGHDGPSLQGDNARETFVCPSCGEDLYARPARSYAELEGLTRRESVWRAATGPPREAFARPAPRWTPHWAWVRWLRRLIPIR